MHGMENFKIAIDRFVLIKICCMIMMKLGYLKRLLVIFLMSKL